jgi:hypothetical protein
MRRARTQSCRNDPGSRSTQCGHAVLPRVRGQTVTWNLGGLPRQSTHNRRTPWPATGLTINGRLDDVSGNIGALGDAEDLAYKFDRCGN